jgi:hypothetical protein
MDKKIAGALLAWIAFVVVALVLISAVVYK